MKILHINYTFGVVGGTESYLYNLIRDLAARGHDSEVVAEKDLTDGSLAPFHPLEEVTTAEKRWGWRHGRRFRSIIHKVNPHIIHIHNTMNADLVRMAAKLRPAMRYVHDHTVICPGLNKVYADGGLCHHAMGDYCMEKYHQGGCFCFRHPTARIVAYHLKKARRLLRVHGKLRKLMVASTYMKKELEKAGTAAGRIVINPYYTAMPQQVQAAPLEGPPLVLTLCRMAHPDKGVIPLLDALGRITVPFRALLVGTGQHMDMMQDHARSLGLTDRVEFSGFVNHPEAVDLIWQARVVAFPSMWNEPFGIVGLEAMARSKPVVAFDVGGVREWLEDGRTGIVVKRGDVDALARALTELLENPARAAALGEAGPVRIRERFVKDRHLDVLEGVYQEILG